MSLHQYAKKSVWIHLGYRDLRARYARTKLGAWWSASTLLTTTIGISLSVALLSGQSAMDVAARAAIAMGVWTMVSSTLIESADSYVADRGTLLNLPISELVMTARLLWRNYLVLLHNSTVMMLFLAISPHFGLWSTIRLSLIVVVLCPIIALTLFVPSLIVSRLGALHPDIRVFIVTAVQLNFFLTPVLWNPPTIGVMRTVFLINPLGWYVQLAKELVFFERFPSELVLLSVTLFVSMGLLYVVLVRNMASIKKYL